MIKFPENSKVNHKTLGTGSVVSDLGDGVVVRFAGGIEICDKPQLELFEDLFGQLRRGKLDQGLAGLSRFQALAIRSVNDKWGVFGRSLITLLPHQLWVCRKARSMSPCRLLVADDVGLGKTIEAGIILSSFLDGGDTRRVLILTPSALVKQWQERMRVMFDVRLNVFTSEQDTAKSSFWNYNDFVVASYHTLRMTGSGRQERLLQADAWDLIIVDEAHHFNRTEDVGATLTYRLLQKMEEHNKIRAMLFFTGTPHKGKNFNFLALMELLSPAFSPKKPLADQLPLLKDYMIRNNKYNVTDLQGNLLFTEPAVYTADYSYTDEERSFYETLTEFIVQGRAYAKTMDHATQNVMMLVLIGMQKLASSSIAAIANALRNRIEKLKGQETKMKEAQKIIEELRDRGYDDDFADKKAEHEEIIIVAANYISLIADEMPALQTLLELAENIKEETKVEKILSVINNECQNKQILLFTEYKATQRLLLEKLMAKFGADEVLFINGDEALDNVQFPDGTKKRISLRRTVAADRFNDGECRFLIATEAAGEGIDLQENCHILFHVDLPWNPMRLHQRVGRLNRYGQKYQVEVRIFRNPNTVESRIWAKLNHKLQQIDQTFNAVMERREDIFQLVLGMANPKMFDDLYIGALNKTDEETLSSWFDESTAMLGNKDAYEAVVELVGNSAKFNYQQVSEHLPKVDLPQLRPFFNNILRYHRKRLFEKEEVLSFQTPPEWKNVFGIFDKYDNYVFNRHPDKSKKQEVLGMGAKVFDMAVHDALSLRSQIIGAGIDYILLIYSVRDLFTDHAGEKQCNIYGCKITSFDEKSQCIVMPDWQLLLLLNAMAVSENVTEQALMTNQQIDCLQELLPSCEQQILALLDKEMFVPQKPIFSLEGIVVPQNNERFV